MKRKAETSKQRGIRKGYRSGLEDRIAMQLGDAGREVLYETEKVHYIVPERHTHYTPDFKIKKKTGYMYIETKGIWTVADRTKHQLIKHQFPELDIRFVFSNANSKIYKGSATSYADYCEKHGFVFANKRIPDTWLKE
tara:strand:+ start:584 stop:997 length:414 start_codon:yes stop_codon:yes gene_type:complete